MSLQFKRKKLFINSVKKILKNNYFLSFVLSLLVGCLIIVPSIIAGNGILTLIADFNSQQIPFNEFLNNAVKNGDILWTWVNDLGSNFIGTFSFYNLTSPFVLLGFLFPSKWFPYLIGPILILKYAFAGLFAYLFLQQYVKDKKWAIIGSLLYSFSGFQITNMLFYSFHDIVAFFPLLLYSLDQIVFKNKKTLFCVAVALCCFINYYFFIFKVIFLIIYYLVRVFTKTYPFSFKNFGKILFNGCLGVGIAMIIFLPSILFVLDNPRVNNNWNILSMLFYDKNTYLEIIRALILPSDVMSAFQHSILSNANYKSIELFLPFVGAVLAFSYVFKNKKNWVTIMFIVCLLFMLIPILNSSFFAFTNVYYARWFYMPTLIMSLLSVKCLDENISIKSGAIITIILFAIFALSLCYIYFVLDIRILYHKTNFLIYLFAFVVCFISLCILMKYSKNTFFWLLIGIILYVTFRGNYFFYQNKGTLENDETYIDEILTTSGLLNFSIDDVRYDFDSSCAYNLGYLGNFPSVKTFITNINGSNFEFWNSIGIPNNSSRIVNTYLNDDDYNLRNLLSIKYVISCNDYNTLFNKKYKFIKKRGKYYIYENTNYKEMGIIYNHYINENVFEKLTYEEKKEVLNYALVLNENQINKYKKILKKYEWGQKIQKSKIKNYSFNFGQASFTNNFDIDTSALIMYSVPYDSGWNATINGEKIGIEKVDNGLMAIKVDKGKNNVVFKYSPPGFKIGTFISICSLAFVIFRKFLRKEGYILIKIKKLFKLN